MGVMDDRKEFRDWQIMMFNSTKQIHFGDKHSNDMSHWRESLGAEMIFVSFPVYSTV